MNSNPYDNFFKNAFRGREEAKGLTENILPAECLQKINLDSIEVIPESLIEPGRRDRYSDLLLCFRPAGKPNTEDSREIEVIGGKKSSKADDILVYCLYEHKSYRYSLAPLQMLGYVLRILNMYHKGTKLPEVIPVLFYHGTKGWIRSRTVQDLFTVEGPHIPAFEPIFVDMVRMENSQIHGTARVILSLLFLKYIKNQFTEEIVRLFLGHLNALQRDDRILKLFYSTLFDVKSESEVSLFEEHARKAQYDAIEEEIMTYTEARKCESKQETLIRQLDRKYGIVNEEKERIMSIHDLDILNAALDEFAVSEEKAAVLAKLEG
jgi:hypothetical protein